MTSKDTGTHADAQRERKRETHNENSRLDLRTSKLVTEPVWLLSIIVVAPTSC